MHPLARAAGLNEIAMHAFRKYLEIAAAGYAYDPETGEPTAARTGLPEAQTAKISADQYRAAVRDAVELSGTPPGTLDKRLSQWVMTKHQDPPPPKSEEELEAERAEEAEREARRQAMMQSLMAANPVLQQQLWSSMAADARFAEIEQRIEQRYSYRDEEDDSLGSVINDDPVPEPSPFVVSVAAATPGTLALEFDPESIPELEMCRVGG